MSIETMSVTIEWKPISLLPEPEACDTDLIMDEMAIWVYFTDGESLWVGYYYLPREGKMNNAHIGKLYKRGWVMHKPDKGSTATHWERTRKVRAHLLSFLPKK